MPKQVDYPARRRQLAEALWRLTHREGWEAISLRKVAAEAGVSMGMVQHTFRTTDQMLAFALQMITEDTRERIQARVTRLPHPPQPQQLITAALTEMIPDPARRTEEIEAAAVFIRRFLLKPDTAAELDAVAPSVRSFLIEQLALARQHDPAEEIEREADTLLVLLDGLIYAIVCGQHDSRRAVEILQFQIERACRARRRRR